jgi:hypothetical protein
MPPLLAKQSTNHTGRTRMRRPGTHERTLEGMHTRTRRNEEEKAKGRPVKREGRHARGARAMLHPHTHPHTHPDRCDSTRRSRTVPRSCRRGTHCEYARRRSVLGSCCATSILVKRWMLSGRRVQAGGRRHVNLSRMGRSHSLHSQLRYFKMEGRRSTVCHCRWRTSTSVCWPSIGLPYHRI